MNCQELQKLLDAGDGLFATLEEETQACLKNIEALSAQEIERFVAARHELVAAIQSFDTSFSQHSGRWEFDGEGCSLEVFRHRQAALLRRVIEMDGLLLAIAEIQLTELNVKQAGISLGRRALLCYRGEGRDTMRSHLKRMA